MLMRAICVERPGGPDVLKIKSMPRPEPRPGWTLLRVRAFGLNRAELFTRQGDSPGVRFPRVIGIECVGEVEVDPDRRLAPGTKVATMMGEMGRAYDGSYAEFTLVPSAQVLAIKTDLDWPTFAAIPEMFQTAHGSLKSLGLSAGQSLLIRGGTSSVGLAAAALAKNEDLVVIATTRRPDRADKLRENGADHVIIDEGSIEDRVRALFPDGVDGVLELVGTKTLNDSLRAVGSGGVCCMTGILGGAWTLDGWNPMEHIRNGTFLTAYHGFGISAADLQMINDRVATGRLRLNLDRVFRFEEIVAAHRYMEENRATGKIVVVVD